MPSSSKSQHDFMEAIAHSPEFAKKAGVDIAKVTQMTIWGNHSSTQFPDFYHAKIDGVSAASVITDETCRPRIIDGVLGVTGEENEQHSSEIHTRAI